MTVSVISDVHAKAGNKSYQTLLSFLKNELVQSSSEIYLLGDVFDFLIGNHELYFELYFEFFEILLGLLKKGVTVHYIEGNHDFHIKKLFNNFLKKNDLNQSCLLVHKQELIVDIEDKKICFTHGDEIDQKNYTYLRYKKLIRSPIFKFIANYSPFAFIKWIGSKLEYKSKNSKYKSAASEQIYYEAFHKLLLQTTPCNTVICGHTHVQVDFIMDDIRYINIGDPSQTNCFIFINDGQIDSVPIVK
ncbi:MAG: UDP-2,3-diacylglucosamine diphosphatase [Bacteriovoracaceae bacterium]|nr:UDP-2,3-diacylglucosamine diphosphatase [Bacteriovoracaceae bacterium]